MTHQKHSTIQKRLAEIRTHIESAGYNLEFNNTDGAKCYKNDEFIHVPEFDALLSEYESLRFNLDEHTDEWDGSFKEGSKF